MKPGARGNFLALLKWLETAETQAFVRTVSQKTRHSLTSLRN